MARPVLKPFRDLTVQDLACAPVWEFIQEEVVPSAECWIRPIEELPVSSLALRIVGTHVRLGNGGDVWATLSNVTLSSTRITNQFLCLSVAREGRWFELARYFDVDYERRGPRQLAEFLDLPMDAVFPISYDISQFVKQEYQAVCGQITSAPQEILSRDDRLSLLSHLRPDTP